MSNHDQLAQQAERMRNTFKDYLDQSNHRQANDVLNELNGLIADLRSKRDGDVVDRRLKTLMDKLRWVDAEVMDHHHSDAISNQCEQMRGQIRNL